jgi:hypothetical protein
MDGFRGSLDQGDSTGAPAVRTDEYLPADSSESGVRSLARCNGQHSFLNGRLVGNMSIEPKARVFVGSSREALPIARALQHELRDTAYCELWSQGLFRIGSVSLDDLVRAANGFDFAVFLFAPDDIVKMRDNQHSAVRDNVLFELGIFIGKLGPQRSFFVVPSSDDHFHVPSDLNGIIPAKYDPREHNLQVAVAAATFEISRAVSMLGPVSGGRGTLFDSRAHGETRMFRGRESHVHMGNQRIGDKGAWRTHGRI